MTENNNLNDNLNNDTGEEVRNNLREAGDALLSAGSAIGAALSKATGELSDRFKTATEDARQNLSNANTEREVRGAATNFTDEAEKLFNSLRERDLQFTDDVKAKLRSTIDEARAAFNERLDGTQTEGIEGTVDDLRARFEVWCSASRTSSPARKPTAISSTAKLWTTPPPPPSTPRT